VSTRDEKTRLRAGIDEEPTLPFSFFPSKVFHHLNPNPAAIGLADFHDLAGIDADEFDLGCRHLCGLGAPRLGGTRMLENCQASGEVGDLISAASRHDTEIRSMQGRFRAQEISLARPLFRGIRYRGLASS